MPLPKPILDNKTFAQLVEEARKLIPVYAPQWTDHNLHDPGITLIDLFAWLTEMQLYSLDQVHDLHRLKYLALLGEKPRSAAPAKVELEFSAGEYQEIKAGTLVKSTQETAEQLYETDENLDLLPLEIKKIYTYTNYRYKEVTAFNEAQGNYFHAFGPEPRCGDSLYLGLETRKPNFPLAGKGLSLGMYLYQQDLPPLGQHGSEPPHVHPSVNVQWQYWNGTTWLPLEKVETAGDTIRTLNAPGHIRIPIPEAFSHQGKPPGLEAGYYWIKCSLQQGEYELAPRLHRVIANVVTATHGRTHSSEYLGRSSGLPGQEFKIANTPMIFGSQELAVITGDEEWETWQATENLVESGPKDKRYQPLAQEGEIRFGSGITGAVPPKGAHLRVTYKTAHEPHGETEQQFRSSGETGQVIKMETPFLPGSETVSVSTKIWKAVADFDASGPADRHYILDPNQGMVTFGSGINGAIPPADTAIRITYRSGGGPHGNLGPGTIVKTAAASITVRNPFPAAGGKEAETITEVFNRVKKDRHVPYTAVTGEDYQDIARATPGLRVARAKALVVEDKTSTNREEIGFQNQSEVKLIVVPYSFSRTPRPGQGFLKTIRNHLDRHRPLTTCISVCGPRYVRVSVRARVNLEKGFDPRETEKRIIEILDLFLSPLKVKPGQNQWPFGRTVYIPEVGEKINGVEGVQCVQNLNLSAAAETGEKIEYDRGNVKISRMSLVYPGTHEITVDAPQERCRSENHGY